jgi:hypothetical protein
MLTRNRYSFQFPRHLAPHDRNYPLLPLHRLPRLHPPPRPHFRIQQALGLGEIL